MKRTAASGSSSLSRIAGGDGTAEKTMEEMIRCVSAHKQRLHDYESDGGSFNATSDGDSRDCRSEISGNGRGSLDRRKSCRVRECESENDRNGRDGRSHGKSSGVRECGSENGRIGGDNRGRRKRRKMHEDGFSGRSGRDNRCRRKRNEARSDDNYNGRNGGVGHGYGHGKTCGVRDYGSNGSATADGSIREEE